LDKERNTGRDWMIYNYFDRSAAQQSQSMRLFRKDAPTDQTEIEL